MHSYQYSFQNDVNKKSRMWLIPLAKLVFLSELGHTTKKNNETGISSKNSPQYHPNDNNSTGSQKLCLSQC